MMTVHRRDNASSTTGEQIAPRPPRAASTGRPPTDSTSANPLLDTGAERSPDVLAYVEVLGALRELNRVERAAVRLVYWHGHTQAQIADELHLAPDAVRAAIANGLRHIADYLTTP